MAKLPRNLLAAAGLALALLAPMHIEAQGPGYDARQIAMLPSYCRYTTTFRQNNVPGSNNPAEIKRWTGLMGGMFQHMHHYCWGLMHTNLAKFSSRTRQQRLSSLSMSIGEFDYVIRNSPPEFVLLPEILTKKGENLIHLGRASLAIPELLRAIELKADYWPPYAALSDHYKEAGDRSKAREWLEKGLSASPGAAPLTQRLAELDAGKGKRKTTPEAATKPAAAAPPEQPAAPAPPEQPAAPEPPAER